MNKFTENHKNVWTRDFVKTVLISLVFLFVSLVINFFANSYVSESVSLPVTDILLSNIPVFDVDGIVIYGAVFLIYFVIAVLIYKPKNTPFVIKSTALFIIIRSIFISLTHIGPFPTHITMDPSKLLLGLGIGNTADLFFSGHTGLPFLYALIFWKNKKLRYAFLFISVVLATSVILGHLHYSIDVFAAYFITYTIFVLAKKFFVEPEIL